ncbi:DUF6777 domain-containing protein [Streptomyces sp. 7R007]
MPEVRWGREEDEVPTTTGTFTTVCALSAALVVAGCAAGDGGEQAEAGREVFLQPAAAQGPDPFTPSTATPAPVTRPAEPAASAQAPRQVSGTTPGLYGGTERVGSCDVERQIDQLTADPAKARAFAEAEGIDPASIPSYLRALAPVQLRADTLVTNHGFRAGGATAFPSVLQAGTAVLVDDRGVPRVRCACGNPLKASAPQGAYSTSGRPWAGYRPERTVVVTPAAQVVTTLTIIDVVRNTWIERHVGHDVGHDRVVPAPPPLTPTPSTPSPRPHDSASPSGSPTDCATPTPAVTAPPGATDALTSARPSPPPTGCPAATATATPPTTPVPGRPESSPGTPPQTAPQTASDSPDGLGPSTVPETPDLPDGGGLIPDDTGSIFDSPTDVFAG